MFPLFLSFFLFLDEDDSENDSEAANCCIIIGSNSGWIMVRSALREENIYAFIRVIRFSANFTVVQL